MCETDITLFLNI